MFKRICLLCLLPLLLLVIQTAQSQITEEVSDTVWTKYTFPESIQAVKFTPDGKYLASGGNSGIPRLWDAETGVLIREFQGNISKINGLDISKTGDRIAVVNEYSRITIWNINTGVLEKVIDPFPYNSAAFINTSIAFSNSGEYIAAGLDDMHNQTYYRTICLYRTTDWQLVSNIGEAQSANKIGFSPDDKMLAIPNMLNGNNLEVQIYSVPNLQYIGKVENSGFNIIYQSAFSPDGSYLAGAIETIPGKVWNTTDWKLFRNIGFSSNSRAVAYSLDSKYVLLGTGGAKKWHLSIWDNTNGKETNAIILNWLSKKYFNTNEGDTPLSISVNQNSKNIAVGGSIGIYMLNAKWNPTSVPENPVQITEPLIFPNPANKTANIRFNLIKSAKLIIGIYDINSNKIASIFDGLLESGLQNFEWNLTKVSSGTYFARITATGAVSTIKIIVNK